MVACAWLVVAPTVDEKSDEGLWKGLYPAPRRRVDDEQQQQQQQLLQQPCSGRSSDQGGELRLGR